MWLKAPALQPPGVPHPLLALHNLMIKFVVCVVAFIFTASRGAAEDPGAAQQFVEETPRNDVSTLRQSMMVNRSYAELNATVLEAMASDISLEEIASEVRGHEYFCAQLAFTFWPDTAGPKYIETGKAWCGSGPRRRGRRRRGRSDCPGDNRGCICGYNIDQPKGGTVTASFGDCDTTRCGFNSGESWSLHWRGPQSSSTFLAAYVAKCALYGTY